MSRIVNKIELKYSIIARFYFEIESFTGAT